jgi:hypothetical protein
MCFVDDKTVTGKLGVKTKENGIPWSHVKSALKRAGRGQPFGSSAEKPKGWSRWRSSIWTRPRCVLSFESTCSNFRGHEDLQASQEKKTRVPRKLSGTPTTAKRNKAKWTKHHPYTKPLTKPWSAYNAHIVSRISRYLNGKPYDKQSL